MIDVSEYIDKLEELKLHWIPKMVFFVSKAIEVENELAKMISFNHCPTLVLQKHDRILRNNPSIQLSGYYKGEKIRSRSLEVYNKFDGYRLDELLIFAELKSRKDCELLIETLQIHKYCFL